MSVNINGAYVSRNTLGLEKSQVKGSAVVAPWVRNPSWPACEAPSGTNKIVGLYAVWPGDGTGNGGNFFAMTNAGAYTINYGDGTVTNYATGVTAYYEFNYNNAALVGTNAPVTFTDIGDLVTRASHGYSNGMMVQFYNIVSTTGVLENNYYYVVNATTNTFQISATLGGSVINLVTNGSATLLPYKIAVVTITPQVANDLTSVNFNVRHSTSLLQQYSTGWLDIAIACPSLTSLTLGLNVPLVLFQYLERLRLNQTGAITSLAYLCVNMSSFCKFEAANGTTSSVTDTSYMFYFCRSLLEVSLFDTSAVTLMNNMFQSCTNLTSIPPFNTVSVTNMSTMFNTTSIEYMPFLNTASVTNMSSMFSNCTSLKEVPLYNTSAVTNMAGLFNGCRILSAAPAFNTAAVTNMSFMFQNCFLLTEVPLYNTSLVTTMASMFLGCSALTTTPLFNTVSVNTMTSMFSGCSSLVTVPLFNTASVTDMSSMFFNCTALEEVPLFNTSAVTNMTSMFASCYPIKSIPLFNTAVIATMTSMFSGCSGLTAMPSLNTATATNMSSMFTGCTSLESIPLLNTALVTTMASMFSGCSSLASVPSLNMASITSAAGTATMFGTCPSLSRIKATGCRFTFSVTACKLSGTALNEIYTNLPTITGQTITVTNNYGTATDNPAIATAKGWTVTG